MEMHRQDQIADENLSSLILTCYVGDTLLGIDALKVQEIVRVPEHTPVHNASEYVIGVMNLRGKIITLIDLGEKMGLERDEDTSESKMVIVDCDDETVGLLVDRVSDVIPAVESSYVRAPSNVHGVHERFIDRVYPSAKGLVAVLNTDIILFEQDS